MDFQKIIDKYYPAGTALRDIYLKHCRAVADEALAISHLCGLSLPDAEVEAAAMLHDIGIYATNAPSIECRGSEPYICHGVIGADLLRREGAPEWAARVAERHTGSGLTAAEIARQGLPLPHRDFLPETQLERLICYADKFYSKSGDMKRKDFGRVRAAMAAFGPESLKRFDAMAREFSTGGGQATETMPE